VGTAVVAMILNGLGFSNRQLYLVPQFFENKPVEHLLGEGITADRLNDDCLGRTLDWIYEHDPTTLFAGLAHQARQHFGIRASQLHADTTSFSVSGTYSRDEADQEGNPVAIAITHGYSRDHREDLKQWMLALVTTHEGDVPLFLRPLDGNSSDKESLATTITQVIRQLREQDSQNEEEYFVVVDSGGYSQANIKQYNELGIGWISRVPETSVEAKQALEEEPAHWLDLPDQTGKYFVKLMDLPQGKERWIVVRSQARVQAKQAKMEKTIKEKREQWEKRLWHVSTQSFAHPHDAEAAWQHKLKGKPAWLRASYHLQEEKGYEHPGRPSKDAEPTLIRWRLSYQIEVDEAQAQQMALHDAAFIIATNELRTQKLPDEHVFGTYKEQGGVERGFRFLKDPLFLASSVFVKKAERIVALSFVMVLCLLVYRLAEHRLREQLEVQKQTIPNQIQKPTARPTMRWVFQCFEGIDLLHFHVDRHWHTQVLRLQPLHEKILRLLGPAYCQFYFLSP
jgi:transposase